MSTSTSPSPTGERDGAGTGHAWANTLYDGYAGLFRLAGLLVGAAVSPGRSSAATSAPSPGARRVWPKLTISLGIAVLTYALLYALTTWFGTFALAAPLNLPV